MVRRKKTTIFTDAKESTTMGELKKMIEGILKVPPENQRLFKDDTVSDCLSINGKISPLKILIWFLWFVF